MSSLKDMIHRRVAECNWDDWVTEIEVVSESPIEKMMGLGLLAAKPPFGSVEEFASLMCSWEREVHGRCPETENKTVIEPQGDVGPYRADFLVYTGVPSDRYIFAIECDGHAFHEKTKAQAERDKKRDRSVVAQGIVVLRYTGAEINRDPYAAAQSAYGAMFEYMLENMRRSR